MGTSLVNISNLSFRMYSDDEIDKISVLKVTNPESFSVIGHNERNGPYDGRLGPMSVRSRDICESCNKDGMKCPGHCGHIDLPLPVFNPFYYSEVKHLLSRVCLECCRYQAQGYPAVCLKYQLKFLNAGFTEEALNVPSLLLNSCEGDLVDKYKESKKTFEMDESSLEIGIQVLDMYFEKITKEKCAKIITSVHSNSVRTEIIKNFNLLINKSKCIYCKKPIAKFIWNLGRLMKRKVTVKNNKEDSEGHDVDSVVADEQSYVSAEQAEEILKNCWKHDKELLGSVYKILLEIDQEYPTSVFFMKKILVVPPKYRPCNFLHGRMVENELSVVLSYIIRLTKAITFMVGILNGVISEVPESIQEMFKSIRGKSNSVKLQNMWQSLQFGVEAIFDPTMNPIAKIATKGIKQIIEKKEGLLRTNLMGKRVDYSARSVAAPDPMLSVDQVGVPLGFAMKLSYPTPVTPWNLQHLRQLVKNGAYKYPGALCVEDEEGKKIRLHLTDEKKRIAIANKLLTPVESTLKKKNMCKIVYRHLEDGDFVLMNRQPTLHRPSIQAHKARVLKDDWVLRMPYANCKAYNADFDGDELNMHFPQNEMARSESKYIITTHNQYLTPRDGSPLAGLIQDCVVAGVMLSMRGKFFNKADFQQLLFSALSDSTDKINGVTPAIIKPVNMWSGKQVITALIKNIIPKGYACPSFDFKTTVKIKLWETVPARKARGGGDVGGKRENMSESEFVMRNGELLCGIIDKCAIGSSSFGLIHTCYDLYGGVIATRLLSAINRLCVYYLQWSGHTISAREFITRDYASVARRKNLKELVDQTPDNVRKKLGIEESRSLADYVEFIHMRGSEKDMANIDGAYTYCLNPTVSNVTESNEEGLLRKSLDNNMRMMVDTGSKGSKINMNQMASLFGSVAIDGKRMPIGMTGKSLPSFPPYEVNPIAGGFIPRRFMTGMAIQNFFFLCIVGRDSLQHTAVKTANSGYMQRCLIKHLEGISVKYDATVRNSDGLVLQFDYGEDGLDVSKVPFFRTYDTMDTLADNCSRLYSKRSFKIAKSTGDPEAVLKYKNKLCKFKEKTKGFTKMKSRYHKYISKLPYSVKKDIESKNEINKEYNRPQCAIDYQNMWYKLKNEEKKSYSKHSTKLDPIQSKFSGDSNFGVVCEAVDDLIENYYNQHYSKRSIYDQKLTKEEVFNTFYMKVLNSRTHAGEAVGALCAQAIGEPLTQMTLNTFHFAGRDELNVTLGVPRMVEILRTASEKISTPIMEIPFLPHVTPETAEKLRLTFGRVFLSNVLEYVDVEEHNEVYNNVPTRCISLKMTFLPYSQYKQRYYTKPSQIIDYVENMFCRLLKKEISNAMEIKGPGLKIIRKSNADSKEFRDDEAEEVGGKEAPASDEEEVDDELGDDVGLASASRNKKVQERDYEESDVEDDGGIVSEDEALGDSVNSDEEDESETTIIKRSRVKTSRKSKISRDVLMMRKNKVLQYGDWFTDYEFDTTNYMWCKIKLALPFRKSKYDFATIVRKTAEQGLVHDVENITRAFVEDKNGVLLLRTEGINLFKMFEYSHLLNINKLYTNNIVTIANVYGIEAAQRSIIKEIKAVQAAYDIRVDFRHLTLLADYFTCEGKYKACSRHSLSSAVSPIQKMSYESSLNFLKTSIINAENERMQSPSASVALGQPVKIGTNVIKIIYPTTNTQ